MVLITMALIFALSDWLTRCRPWLGGNSIHHSPTPEPCDLFVFLIGPGGGFVSYEPDYFVTDKPGFKKKKNISQRRTRKGSRQARNIHLVDKTAIGKQAPGHMISRARQSNMASRAQFHNCSKHVPSLSMDRATQTV